MVNLYSFGEGLGVIDSSPFVVKVDAFLRMAHIEFTHVPSLNNLKQAPKGKLPFIVIGDQTIADSQQIIDYFQSDEKTNLDKHLSEQQRAQCYLLSKSLEENLYNILMYSRWCRDDTWPIIRDTFFSTLPMPIRQILPAMLRRKTKKGLYDQGIARHSDQELQIMMRKNMQALSNLLTDSQYFFGDRPCSFDASAFGFLTAFISVNIDNPFNTIAREYRNLVDFCHTIEQKYY